MQLSFLADTFIKIIDVNGSIDLNFLAKFIGILIGAVGITGIGIILYCLILKTAVLPLDIWQKISMRKQSLKMEQMRSQLEKLQKQYANTPDVYQRKVQEVYKQNGYSMFSSCLPMIATLVILIIAFNSLTSYSQNMNLEVYKGMANAYNSYIVSAVDEDATPVDCDKDGYYKYESEDSSKFIYFIALKSDKNKGREYYIDTQRMLAVYPDAQKDGVDDDKACEQYLEKLCSKAAADYYYSRKTSNNQGISFLLTQNIFYPDVAWAHPLQSYDDFCSSITKEIVTPDGKEVSIKNFISEDNYNKLTASLSEEKSEVNGFFILVVLTILSNLGAQFITMRSQKAQRELQSVDKTSQSMQKWMMFLMPVMFCIFAFIYSAAFSLYLITSSIYSVLTTVVVNYFIDKAFNKVVTKETEVRTSGRQAYTRDWAKNAQIRADQEKYGRNNNKKK